MSSDSPVEMRPSVTHTRVTDLARELEVKAKTVIDLLPLYGVTEKKTHSSSIPVEVAEKIRQTILAGSRTPPASAVAAKPANVLRLPKKFTFHRGFVDFDFVLGCFDWSLKEVPVVVDLTTCESANYQA